jgi:hypothetical protein
MILKVGIPIGELLKTLADPTGLAVDSHSSAVGVPRSPTRWATSAASRGTLSRTPPDAQTEMPHDLDRGSKKALKQDDIWAEWLPAMRGQ